MRSIRLIFALLALMVLPAVTFAQVRVGIAVRIAPPELPVYEQPLCPGDGYMWTPGYWAWDDGISDYYWVPGLWVEAPEVGFLWTPGYWGWEDTGYFFHEGYWGPTVGFYGGISYGFGYFGGGFVGGRWDGGRFFYNTTVVNVDVTVIHNTYNTRVDRVENRVSFNGGQGGINRRPTPEEERAASERHIAPVAAQTQHVETAKADPQARNSVNHGRPAVAAVPSRGEEPRVGQGAANDRGANDRGTNDRPANGQAGNSGHARDLQPITQPRFAGSGDAKADKKFQKDQDKLVEKQNKEQQKLQQQQEADHQKKLNDADHQAMEQRHQQQTQSMQQRHSSEMQNLQQRAPAPRPEQARPPKK